MCGGGLFYYLAELLANPWDGPLNRFIFSNADISYFPLVLLAIYAFFPAYKYGSKIFKFTTVTLLFLSILLFAVKSSYAGLGLLGIVMKFTAGAVLSYVLLKAKSIFRSIYMLVLILMIAVEVRLIPLTSLEQWGPTAWILALGAGLAIYDICQKNSRRYDLTNIDRVLFAAIFAFFVLLNYHATVIAPVGSLSFLNLIFFKYIFAVGILTGQIWGQVQNQRETAKEGCQQIPEKTTVEKESAQVPVH